MALKQAYTHASRPRIKPRISQGWTLLADIKLLMRLPLTY